MTKIFKRWAALLFLLRLTTLVLVFFYIRVQFEGDGSIILNVHLHSSSESTIYCRFIGEIILTTSDGKNVSLITFNFGGLVSILQSRNKGFVELVGLFALHGQMKIEPISLHPMIESELRNT